KTTLKELAIQLIKLSEGRTDDKDMELFNKIKERIQKFDNKKHSKITQKGTWIKIVTLFDDFIKRYSQSPLVIEAEFNIARLYIAKKEYENARKQLQSIMDKYKKSDVIYSEALFLMGKTYELQDNWEAALIEYKKNIQNYPATARGLSMPIYIAQYYKTKFQPEKMRQAYQEAIRHYQDLIQRHPDSILAYNAHNLIAQCYVALKDWQSAIESYDTIVEKYKGKVNLDAILMTEASIYNTELNDKTKARQLLEQLIKDYPKSGLINVAKGMLRQWEKK
ncbi:MAG: tetratricopeptide repeat protein, partial [Candidatus Omnitrophica bacterium]|nr:tetratricopeptide repeat protein [Candidatus Omnitrophota bacterium]